MKKLALFDLDRTIYNNHTFFELADYEVKNGVVPRRVWIDIQELLEKYKSGQLSYSTTANQLLEVYCKSLKGIRLDILFQHTKKYFEQNSSNFYPYFDEIAEQLTSTYDIYIVTTNAQYVADAICQKYNLAGYISSEFEVIDNNFSGKLKRSLADGKEIAKDLVDQYGFGESIAVGDSENDIGMLEIVNHAFCINPSDRLKYIAEKNDWKVVSEITIKDAILNIVKN